MSMDLQSPPALFDLENGIGDEEQVADSEVLADDVVEIDMGKSIAFKQLFSTISEHFGITHSEYGYRCRSALFPYIAFKPTADNTGNFISRIRSSIKTKISNPNASLELDGNVPNDVREPDLCSTTLGHIKSINEKPDVYGFIWINVSTASSLYIAHNVGIMLANKVNFTTITTFFSLLTFFLGCSCTSVLEMFLCHYYFTNKLKISSLMPMLSISGYIQIPFAICCKIVAYIEIWRSYIPFISDYLFVLKGLCYTYVCLSTMCTLCLGLIPIDDRNGTYKLVTGFIVVLSQIVFMQIIQLTCGI